jgi:3-oxoacid CoA-transferase
VFLSKISPDRTKSIQIRALDHAVELLYHPLASEIPTKRLALEAIRDLFTYLPLSKSDPSDADVRQKLFLAAYASLFPFLYTGGVGLSHSIGHALGATYSIPHGITSCLTLSPVVKLKAKTRPEEAKMIARAIPYIGKESTGSVEGDADAVGDAIAGLVEGLGHKSTLTQVCYSSESIILILTCESVSRSARRGSIDCIACFGEG